VDERVDLAIGGLDLHLDQTAGEPRWTRRAGGAGGRAWSRLPTATCIVRGTSLE
jgi:hypothetical protein